MKKLIIAVGAALLGFGGGVYLGWYLGKKKYIDIADQEVESVKKRLTEYYTGKTEDKVEEKPAERKEEAPKEETKTEKKYKNYAGKYQTGDAGSRVVGTPEDKKPVIISGPPSVSDSDVYPITLDEFNKGTYEMQSLLYFKDEVLTDEDLNPLLNARENVGEEYAEFFDVYESDEIYIRNDILKIDFSIIKDERTYSKIRPLGNVTSDDGVDD